MIPGKVESCLAECNCTSETPKDAASRCCFTECNFRALNIIGKTSHFEGINVEGLKFSFLLAVNSKFKLKFQKNKIIL